MNLKKLLLISSVLLTLSIITIIIFNNMDDHKVYEINEEKEYNNSFLTLMIETEADSGIYEKSNSSLWPGDGYIFNEQMSSCENGGELSWNEELNTINLKTNTAEKCYVYFDIYSPPTLADYIKSQYNGTQGNNGIYYHTSSLANSAEDNSYRYSGANPNNYVCFGSDASTCPSDNQYRIIGVFKDEVKLIKSTNYGNYAWDLDNSNAWNADTKPDIYATLNSIYLNSLENTWSDKISTHNYEVGGMDWSNNAKDYYDLELGFNQSGYVQSMKIGLMYVSDYGFAITNNYWTEDLSNSNYNTLRNYNWMYLGSDEWTISRLSFSSTSVFAIYGNGYFSINDVGYSYSIRPCFYLNSDVAYVSGTGSESDPIRIN